MGRAQGQRQEPADFSSYHHDDSPIGILFVDCIDRAFRSVTARRERDVNFTGSRIRFVLPTTDPLASRVRRYVAGEKWDRDQHDRHCKNCDRIHRRDTKDSECYRRTAVADACAKLSKIGRPACPVDLGKRI